MEKINNLFFTVSYNSFFQVNNYINLELFNLIKENIVGKAWIRMNTIELISHIDGYKKAEEKNRRKN